MQRESFTTFEGTSVYTTAWLRLQGQQDYFRTKCLYISGYWPSMNASSTLVVTAEYDYGKSGAHDETHTITQANLTRAASGYFEAKIALQNQKGESVRLTARMSAVTTTEEPRIINLGVEVAPMEGGNKMPYTTTTVS